MVFYNTWLKWTQLHYSRVRFIEIVPTCTATATATAMIFNWNRELALFLELNDYPP